MSEDPSLLAPFAFLRQRLPDRRNIAEVNDFSGLDIDGQKSFHISLRHSAVPGGWSQTQTFPKSFQGRASFYTPPPHYHLLQDEHFRVLSGQGIWHLWDNKIVRVGAGGQISVPSRAYHWFENDTDSDEPLVVEYWYDKEYAEMEERFFKNTLGYLADCIRHGQNTSKVQMCVFAAWNLMPLAIIKLEALPHSIALVINTLLTAVVAFVGEFLMGYQRSYHEYYSKRKST